MNRKWIVDLTRLTRVIHRAMSAYLVLVFLLISVSGILLGWKKNSNDYLLPTTVAGSTSDMKKWLSIDTLNQIAHRVLEDTLKTSINIEFARIDVRPDKGIVKFTYDDNYWGIQMDGATGAVLQVGKRRSDLIEDIHDGSILDQLFTTNNEIFKLIYTSLTGLSLFIFSITGIWLWLSPLVLRRLKEKTKIGKGTRLSDKEHSRSA